MPGELWTEVCDILQETGIKTIPKRKKSKKPKWLSEEALRIAVKEEKQKGKEKRKNMCSFEYRVPKKTRRDKKAFLSDQYKEIEESSKMGKTRDLFRKLEMLREHFMQRWAQ